MFFREGIHRLFKALALAAACVFCVGTYAQSSETVNLSGEEITALVQGKTIATQNTRWGAVRLQFRADGGLYGNKNGGADSGQWRVEDGKLCLEWRRWDYAGCGVVKSVGREIQHLWPDGRVHFVIRP